MNVSPAIVIVPVRDFLPEFAVTEKFTVPLPLPLVPDEMVIHDAALLVAVQSHPFCAVTIITPVPPVGSVNA